MRIVETINRDQNRVWYDFQYCVELVIEDDDNVVCTFVGINYHVRFRGEYAEEARQAFSEAKS